MENRKYKIKYVEHLLNEIVWNITNIVEEENEINEGIFTEEEYDKIINIIKIINKEIEEIEND